MYSPQANPHATPILPPELLEKILDELIISPTPQQSYYDVKTLKSWSLVSRAWAPRAQRRVFYDLDLVFSRERMALEIIENVLQYPERHGHLVTYIRSLRIHRSGANLYGPVLCPRFPEFLNRLKMLREISISLVASKWRGLSAAEHEALTWAFQSPSLRTISVDVYGGFPLSLLSSFGPAVQALRIGARSLTIKRPYYPPYYFPGTPNLKHLEINTTNAVRSLSRFLTNKSTNDGSFHSLESIRLVLRTRNIPASITALEVFIKHCPSLRRFGIASRSREFPSSYV